MGDCLLVTGLFIEIFDLSSSEESSDDESELLLAGVFLLKDFFISGVEGPVFFELESISGFFLVSENFCGRDGTFLDDSSESEELSDESFLSWVADLLTICGDFCCGFLSSSDDDESELLLAGAFPTSFFNFFKGDLLITGGDSVLFKLTELMAFFLSDSSELESSELESELSCALTETDVVCFTCTFAVTVLADKLLLFFVFSSELLSLELESELSFFETGFETFGGHF